MERSTAYLDTSLGADFVWSETKRPNFPTGPDDEMGGKKINELNVLIFVVVHDVVLVDLALPLGLLALLLLGTLPPSELFLSNLFLGANTEEFNRPVMRLDC
jgi:hypothetical protein